MGRPVTTWMYGLSAQRIKNWRKQYGLTQAQLQYMISGKMSNYNVTLWEREIARPDIRAQNRLNILINREHSPEVTKAVLEASNVLAKMFGVNKPND